MPQLLSSIFDSSSQQELFKSLLPAPFQSLLKTENSAHAFLFLTLISDKALLQPLKTTLQLNSTSNSSGQNQLDSALDLIKKLKQFRCNSQTAFKYRLPLFIGEYPVHSKQINSKIANFNKHIETYYQQNMQISFNEKELNKDYQKVLLTLEKHAIGSNVVALWQLLRALCNWSLTSLEELLVQYPALYEIVSDKPKTLSYPLPISNPAQPEIIDEFHDDNKVSVKNPFSFTFNYKIDGAGRIERSNYLLLNGFALKPGGHADALSKSSPVFISWSQWQGYIKRQLSQLVDIPLDKPFFYWFQSVLAQLGVEFIPINGDEEYYVSPFLSAESRVTTLNEDSIISIMHSLRNQLEIPIKPKYISTLATYAFKFVQEFQFNPGQALGIGANWDGAISFSNEAGADAFLFNDSEWATSFRLLSTHRQGPAEALMNASIGIKYELAALCSSFDYMTQLQTTEYQNTLYNALVDNLVSELFPEPKYFENSGYVKYRRHYILHSENQNTKIEYFYIEDPQGTYFKTKKNEFKQTPMYRQAGSLNIEPFPRDIASGDSLQSSIGAPALWPLQKLYAQSSTNSIRGHHVYNPFGPDEFLPDVYNGQFIRESDHVLVPFIGVLPKNFDRNFNQTELCASFVVRMLHSSRIINYCPAFKNHYNAILARFLPHPNQVTPPLPAFCNKKMLAKWKEFDHELRQQNRQIDRCKKTFSALFKELIYSLYQLAKNDTDIHHYFIHLMSSNEFDKIYNRSHCESLIRELKTLMPLGFVLEADKLQEYQNTLSFLEALISFYFPYPNDEYAQEIAKLARIHSHILLKSRAIQDYFQKLSANFQENISPKITPGLFHDSLRYGRPSPQVFQDFYKHRHQSNFYSGFRDVNGHQIYQPTKNEKLLDKIVKTIGGMLPLIHRNKTLFSLITQPISQAYIAGHKSHQEKNKLKYFWTSLSSIRGFLYGATLGIFDTLSIIPRSIYTNFFAKIPLTPLLHNAIAISSAPKNQPGNNILTIMEVRDSLLESIANKKPLRITLNSLISSLQKEFFSSFPHLYSDELLDLGKYENLLKQSFPLQNFEWDKLSSPLISAHFDKAISMIFQKYSLHIDTIFIHALYNCLTSCQLSTDCKQLISEVVKKFKLQEIQQKALNSLLKYYLKYPEKIHDHLNYFRFAGSINKLIKEKQQSLAKLQIWIGNALDQRWILESFFKTYFAYYQEFLLERNLQLLLPWLPEKINFILHQLITHDHKQPFPFEEFSIESSEKNFILSCFDYFRKYSVNEQRKILETSSSYQYQNFNPSIKVQEHQKYISFLKKQWQHQQLPLSSAQDIIYDLKKLAPSSLYRSIDNVFQLYDALLQREETTSLDEFYFAALALQNSHPSMLIINDWINVCMNVAVNKLLDQCTLTDDSFNNLLINSTAAQHWLHHLVERQGMRSLLSQQIQQTTNLDSAATRCQFLLNAVESASNSKHRISSTGMQQLLRMVYRNQHALGITGKQECKNVSITTLCKHSITMSRAKARVEAKVPDQELIRGMHLH